MMAVPAAASIPVADDRVLYRSFYELSELPFTLTSNPLYFLMTPGHREALSNIEYGIASRNGLTLILGEAGTGKTTVLQRAFALRGNAPGSMQVILSNPTLTIAEFVETLAVGF